MSLRCDGAPPLVVALELVAEPLGDGEYEVVLRVENRTVVRSGLDRASALARSLLSTHPIVRVAGGRFVSALERPCGSVNTFPVLASAADDAVSARRSCCPITRRSRPRAAGACSTRRK